MNPLRRIGAAFQAGMATLRGVPMSPSQRVPLIAQMVEEMRTTLRGWSGAESDRLTEKHYGSAHGSAINQDLVQDLTTLRDRCRWERQHNGILEGMARTHALDVVGPRGPTLQIVSKSNQDYADRLEDIWATWTENCDICEEGDFADLLTQDIVSEWDNGESLKQLVNDPQAAGIQLRLQTIRAGRLASPYGLAGTDLRSVTLGVRRNTYGKPLSYFIREDVDSEFVTTVGNRYIEIGRQNMIHDFLKQEPGQVRGAPLMSASLHVIAQLRDWDRDVQQAMRMAAMLALIFYCESPNAKPAPMIGTMDMEAGMMASAPPGYKVQQTTPGQPGQKYNDFRDAKLAEIGRPVGMPLMTVKLDSSNHNYSSARFDGQTYNRVIEARQGRMERKSCRPCLGRVEREAQLLGKLGRLRPDDLELKWGWPKRPHVDPGKEADAIHIRLEDGTIDQEGACNEFGTDVDVVRAKRVQQGLPAGPTWLAQGTTSRPGAKPDPEGEAPTKAKVKSNATAAEPLKAAAAPVKESA